MKNKLFKIFSLTIVLLLLATGCQSKEGKVNKVKKKVEINVDSEKIKQENILHYYDINYTSYKNKKAASKVYDSLIDSLYRYEEDEVKELSKGDNYYEATTKEEPTEGSIHTKTSYAYTFLIKNDNELIEISDYSYDSDITYMQEVSKEFKKYVSKYSTLREAYDEYCKDYNLVITASNDVIVDESIGEMYVSNASNQYTVVQYDEEGTVENVVLENIELTGGLVKTLAVGKTKDGKRIWSFDLGITEKSMNYKDSVSFTKGEYYVYFGYYSLQARDIQTGKLVWDLDEFDAKYDKIIETKKNGIYAFAEEDSDYHVVIVDYFGDKIDAMDIDMQLYKEDLDKYFYIKNLDSLKLNGDLITIDLYESTKSNKVVGQLVINTNTKRRSIELNK